MYLQVPEETATRVDEGKDGSAKSAAQAFAEQFKLEDTDGKDA
jgi:hypothetical protein